jgi:hypothetical protein
VRGAIAGLIVDLPDPSLRWLVEELALPAHSADAGAFESLRRIPQRLVRLRQRSPRAFAVCELHARRHRRLRERLHLVPSDLAKGPTVTHTFFTALAALPAAAGFLLNAPPAALTATATIRFSDPVRIGMARIVAGLVGFAGWYASTTIGLALVMDSVWKGLAATLFTATLGMLALIWNDAWSSVRGPMRFMLLQWCQPRLIAQLRREREVLRPLRKWLVQPPRRWSYGMVKGSIP